MPDHKSLPQRIRFPEWQPAYEAAILEMDKIAARNRIAEAEAAIFNRLHKTKPSAIHDAERQALQNAVFMLHIVKHEAAAYSL